MTQLLVGTRKGLYVLEGETGAPFEVEARAFAGEAVEYAMRDPRSGRVFASVTSAFYGPKVFYADDPTAEAWEQAAGLELPEGGDHALERIWVVVPGEDDGVIYAGGDPGVLFESRDGGATFTLNRGLWEHPSRHRWQPGAGGLCLHTIILDPVVKDRIYVAISAAGAFRSDDAGQTWLPINKGLRSGEIPDTDAEVGHCVHHITQHPTRPDTLFMQKHWDVMRTDDAGAQWREISGDLPSDFGFPIAVHAHEPDTIYVVPITSDSQHFPPDGKLRVYRSRSGGDDWQPLTNGLPQSHCYVNVLRDAMAVDTLDDCGIYFGTTGGQVYHSSDSGDTWQPIVRDLPAVLSVEVQVLP
jgi:photosystem II stability/assembly factor-like uncharacterized protein